MDSQTCSNKPLSKPFVYKLYKTYEAAYSDASLQHAKTLAVVKVQQVTNISRATVYKILKEARENGEFSSPGIRRKRVRAVNNHKIKEIKEKIITLSERKNGFVPLKRIYSEVIKDGIFKGSKGLLRTLMREMGFFYGKCDDRWKLILREKNLPDVPLDLDQRQIDNYSVPNMMEVKHSPAAQIEFRSPKNGLPDDDESNLDTLFDSDVKKSVTSNDKQEAKALTLNGVSKHTEEEASGEVEEVHDGDLLTQLDLDPELVPEQQATKSTVTTKVRDTGRDLDTLLSKINDLVEDCEEVKPEEDDDDKGVEIVEIDDELEDDEVEDTGKCEDTQAKANPANDNPEAKADEKLAEEHLILEEPPSKETDHSNVMDSDDVVCLDSPSPVADKDSQPEAESFEEKKDIVKEKSAQEITENELEKKEDFTKISEVSQTSAEVKQNDDDEVYLIEDDDDEEDVNTNKSSEQLKESSSKDKEESKTITVELKVEPEQIAKPDKENQKTEPATDSPPPTTTGKILEDDDIVCLDDSLEDNSKSSEQETETSKSPDPQKVESVSEELVTEQPVDKPIETQTESAPVEEKVNAESTAPGSKEVSTDTEKVTVETTESPSNGLPDVDIVILDDDDEVIGTVSLEKTPSYESPKEEPPTASSVEDSSLNKQAEEKPILPEEPVESKPSTIIPDNSDNARDGGEEKDEITDKVVVKEKSPIPSEENTQSNSSSNLLKASEDREEAAEQPPSKRIRLSQDEPDSTNSPASQEDTKSNNLDEALSAESSKLVPENEASKSLKRTHSSESLLSESKKTKTEEEPAEQVFKTEPVTTENKVDAKPLPLYPPPKLDLPVIDLSLDFLKRFKKSLHKMTKTDLEELVLQKIVEAVVHKSEFSEMRELIEKQEKIIAGHRTKITELNKQFRDLEMVHNRVLKDLETKNSQFIMPVKITRAVGLQVCFPNKKYDQPLVVPPTQPSVQTSPVPAPRNPTNSNAATIDNRASQPGPSQASSSSMASVANKIPPSIASSLQQQASAQRRGCIQKLTPMRPDTPRNSPLNRTTTVAAVASSISTPPIPNKDVQPKVLNRMLAQKKSIASTCSPPANGLAPMATHPTPSGVPPSIATKKVSMPPRYSDPPAVYKNKAKLSANTTQPKACQPEQQSSAVHSQSAVESTVSPQIPHNQTNSTPAANPPSKSVIDLTDEDDVLPPPAANSPRTPMPPQAAVPPSIPPTAPATAIQTPMTSPVAAANRSKVYAIAQQQLQQLQKPNPPKQTPQRIPVSIAPKPNGLAIAVRQIPSNPSRYRHPAPLPNQPVQTSNPAWKLPPARPTIRISNLESGIVISWTIEDTAKDKYAESTSYQIYAYQETSGPPLVESWRHVGDVKAMLLPMAVTLTQFQEGQRYYFAVRAVDAYNRCGPFSFAKTWS